MLGVSVSLQARRKILPNDLSRVFSGIDNQFRMQRPEISCAGNLFGDCSPHGVLGLIPEFVVVQFLAQDVLVVWRSFRAPGSGVPPDRPPIRIIVLLVFLPSCLLKL